MTGFYMKCNTALKWVKKEFQSSLENFFSLDPLMLGGNKKVIDT